MPVQVDAKTRKGEKLTAIERQLVGKWLGRGGCAGDIEFRADGSFTRTNNGQAGIRLDGTWVLKWDALPPTLVLAAVGNDGTDWTQTLRLVRLDNKALAYRFPNLKGESTYGRAKPKGR